jgi:hypothetical protein
MSLSSADILRVVRQMNSTELDQFVSQVLAVRARRRANSIPHAEAVLLQKINTPLPQNVLTRYRELITARREERLTSEEYQELLHLSGTVENFNSQRIEWLAELAKLRSTTLVQVMNDLKITPLAYE